MTKRMQNQNGKDAGLRGIYTSKIIKAGALLDDTRSLLSQWNQTSSIEENLNRFRIENLLAKSSSSRTKNILSIFRQRYLTEDDVGRALVALVKGRFPAASLDRALYFHATRSDPLLRDVVIEYLVPRRANGITDIGVTDVQQLLLQWCQEGRASRSWSESTARRIAQGLLSTLRDFGILKGAVKKTIAPSYLPTEAFAYIVFYLKQHQPSGAKLVELSDWKLFFLDPEGVERFLIEAHQQNLLEYHAAGTVTRLTFPVETLEEYAHVLTQGEN